MDLTKFGSDEEIVKYLKTTINQIGLLNECRLFKEEQLQITDEVIHFRNCIEWIIRANSVIQNIIYALLQSLSYAQKMTWPLEETAEKIKYSYYLEDAVYRDIVLWDIYRQLLNEYYKCGYLESDSISIFSFLKAKKKELGKKKAENMISYLNSADHKKVRVTLRNSFTHSVDATSSYFFHRNYKGKIKPEVEHILPNHPYDNICFVVEDLIKLNGFMSDTIIEMKDYLNNKIALINVSATLPCGVKIDDPEHWNLGILKEQYERIFIPCDHPCEKAHPHREQFVCKPVEIYYCRINTTPGKCDGTLIPQMSFEDIEKRWPEE